MKEMNTYFEYLWIFNTRTTITLLESYLSTAGTQGGPCPRAWNVCLSVCRWRARAPDLGAQPRDQPGNAGTALAPPACRYSGRLKTGASPWECKTRRHTLFVKENRSHVQQGT